MTFNPFDGPSPWGEATTPQEIPPMTNPAPADGSYPFELGITLKGAADYGAEWLTPKVHGMTGDELAKRVIELVKALADNGVIETVSNTAVWMREKHQPPGAAGAAAAPRFVDGKVQGQAQAATPAPQSGDSCTHGRTHRTGSSAKGPWEAMFCNAPQGPGQCKPLFRQRDGSWA